MSQQSAVRRRVVLEIAEDARTEKEAVSSRRPDVLASVAVIVFALVLGYLGWILPIPGGSLVVPALIVFGVGAGIALVGWVAASFRPFQRWRWIFAVGVRVVAVRASIWTFSFSLPASLAWDEGATAQTRRWHPCRCLRRRIMASHRCNPAHFTGPGVSALSTRPISSARSGLQRITS